jgi:copper chaperone CopZ
MKKSTVACDLCGLSLRYDPVVLDASGKSFRFCCLGCKQVFHMLLESSDAKDPDKFRQTDLFKKCQKIGIIPKNESDLTRFARSRPPSRPAVKKSESKTTEAELEAHNLFETDTLSLQLKISGMWCPACAWVIDETLKRHPGVVDAACNFSTDRLRCEYNPVKTSPDKIINIINNLGYNTVVAGEEGTRGKRAEFIRFVISAFLTMNVMMLSFAQTFLAHIFHGQLCFVLWWPQNF